MKKRKYNVGGSVTGMSTGNQGYTANNSTTLSWYAAASIATCSYWS